MPDLPNKNIQGCLGGDVIKQVMPYSRTPVVKGPLMRVQRSPMKTQAFRGYKVLCLCRFLLVRPARMTTCRILLKQPMTQDSGCKISCRPAVHIFSDNTAVSSGCNGTPGGYQ